MLDEAPGPMNFTQMVTLFAGKMAGGTDDDETILKSFELSNVLILFLLRPFNMYSDKKEILQNQYVRNASSSNLVELYYINPVQICQMLSAIISSNGYKKK